MRIKQVMSIFIRFLYRFTDLFIGIGCTGYLSRNSSMRTTIKIEHTGKVTRIAHIHGICNSGNGWTRIILTRLQILIENIILIISSDKAFHG